MRFSGLAFLFPALLAAQTTQGPTVRFSTNLGDIDVLMLPGSAPQTVANFLRYVNRQAYDGTVFHRSVSNFVIQGGGYKFSNARFEEIPTDPAVRNEFGVSNTRGTIAMAKLGNDPNSATSQWFFNLGDNSRNLDLQNGGFTVFGRIANTEGLAVMDRIAGVPRTTVAGFEDVPVIDYAGGAVSERNLVVVNSIRVLDAAPAPVIRGIVSASNFGGYAYASAGQFIEIYGDNLSTVERQWARSDFFAGRAPTNLSGVTVKVNGRDAYVSYVSPTQINVQMPMTVPASGEAEVVVTVAGQASAPYHLAMRPLSAGLLAPPSFRVDGRQFVAPVRPATGALITRESPARPGETILFYGTGFGPTNPNTFPFAGQTVNIATSLATPYEFRIGDTVAQVLFAGLAPEYVGLYQFNVTVPADAPDGDLLLRVTLGGQPIAQTLFLPVRRL